MSTGIGAPACNDAMGDSAFVERARCLINQFLTVHKDRYAVPRFRFGLSDVRKNNGLACPSRGHKQRVPRTRSKRRVNIVHGLLLVVSQFHL
jgi:hypothetical protein